MKFEIYKKMIDSKSINELNKYWLELLNIPGLAPKEISELYGDKYCYSEKDTDLLFSVKKYKLHNTWCNYILKIGIPVDLSKYPNIEFVVEQLKELNSKSSGIFKEFKIYKKAELKKMKNQSDEFHGIQNELNSVLEETKLLEAKRHEITTKYSNWIEKTEEIIADNYGFVDPNIEIDYIKMALI